tara:strand:+ start:228 stop:719 length:492 start_codon:yes stop_codon:yes gene_type:complete
MALSNLKFKGFNASGKTGQSGARTGKQGKFTGAVDSWIAESKAAMEAVYKESFQRLLNEAQEPSAKGGHMRVRTGFLRNSGIANIGSIPIGADVVEGPQQPDRENTAMVLVINKLQIGQTIFFGWTANYAIHRENKDGFVRRAVQNWPQIVSKVNDEVRAALK